jgi:hypothetical protein
MTRPRSSKVATEGMRAHVDKVCAPNLPEIHRVGPEFSS